MSTIFTDIEVLSEIKHIESFNKPFLKISIPIEHVFCELTMEKNVVSVEEAKIYEEKVMEWIEDHFVLNEIDIEDYPFFSYGKLVCDKQGESMIVYWCVIYGRVDYRFQNA
ncbi:hypothetical protein J6TS1_32800 [Siminovitchia terrae]|uniref:Phage protein n=2 Tax=Siminovitchia terrae TaxID=1914933 RepID=A0ABQ4L0P6_SIMTE|nr:hypothetical protein J6TS1_32800 [Siminovitchia terrae]